MKKKEIKKLTKDEIFKNIDKLKKDFLINLFFYQSLSDLSQSSLIS